jgi:membrane-bound inhibitor of C-type lysozyme
MPSSLARPHLLLSCAAACVLTGAVLPQTVLARPARPAASVFACVGEEQETLRVAWLGSRAQRARLTYKGETVVTNHAASADGGLYVGKDVEFWTKGEDAVLEWRGEKMKCALDEE